MSTFFQKACEKVHYLPKSTLKSPLSPEKRPLKSSPGYEPAYHLLAKLLLRRNSAKQEDIVCYPFYNFDILQHLICRFFLVMICLKADIDYFLLILLCIFCIDISKIVEPFLINVL